MLLKERTPVSSLRAAGSTPPIQVEGDKNAKWSGGKFMKSLKILLVEDDSLIAMLLTDTLGEMGHDVCGVEATENGAISAALRYRPDLILVDAQLKEGSGIDAVDTILATIFIPHVFMSGDIRTVFERRPKAIALQKPFQEIQLEAAIRRALVAA
jgi:CheY-like chemotaxis protein